MANNPKNEPGVGRDADLTLKHGTDTDVNQVWNTDGFTVEEEVEMHDITVCADGYWRRFKPGMKTWRATINCIGAENKGTPMIGEPADFVGTYFSGITATGDCYINRVSTAIEKKGEYRFTVEVLGDGELTKSSMPSSTYEAA